MKRTTTKVLPRDVFLAVERSRAAVRDDASRVFVHFPTQGMLRAEKLGLIECYDQNQSGACAYRRTEKGEQKYTEYEQARKFWLRRKP